MTQPNAATSVASICGNCIFWVLTNQTVGLCRKSAPYNLFPGTLNNWPYTSYKSWCGDYATQVVSGG